jgi:hypothetical protein
MKRRHWWQLYKITFTDERKINNLYKCCFVKVLSCTKLEHIC